MSTLSEQAQDLLISQFREIDETVVINGESISIQNAVKFNAVLAALVDPLQELVNTYEKIYNLYDIDNAEGEQLDFIGDIVGEDRAGKTDAEYRSAINLRIYINRSNGESGMLILFAKALTGATFVCRRDIYPAKTSLFLWIPSTSLNSSVVTALGGVALGGVAVEVLYAKNDKNVFAWEAEDGMAQIPHSGQFGEDNETESENWGVFAEDLTL